MEDLPYKIEFSWKSSGTVRTCIARALDEEGRVIGSISVGVTADGIDLPAYCRQQGHLPDTDVENIAREELHKKLRSGDTESNG